jgi:hypothetical protein
MRDQDVRTKVSNVGIWIVTDGSGYLKAVLERQLPQIPFCFFTRIADREFRPRQSQEFPHLSWGVRL